MHIGVDETDSRLHWNRRLHAFTEFDSPAAGRDFDQQLTEAGRLSGTTFGVKDVIDVAGFATRNGSRTCGGARPAEVDAPVVAALRDAGARFAGKTVTTEFAFTDPTNCRNPYDLARSPGGSSSGSGAAVGAGMVDFALGTQTAGSLCRPAAYCGVVGFKPSFGWTSTDGVTPLARSFDTVGIIARNVDLATKVFHAIQDDAGSAPKHPAECATARVLWDTLAGVTADTLRAFGESAAALARIGAQSTSPEVHMNPAQVVADHRVVMNKEAFDAHGHLLKGTVSELVGPRFSAGLRAGSEVSSLEYDDALSRLKEARSAFWSSMSATDVLLTLPVPEGAPLLDGTTGFQDWLTPWTVFGGPLLCLPWGLDPLGRPRSVMLAAHPGAEATLLAMAAELEREAPHLPPPRLPDD